MIKKAVKYYSLKELWKNINKLPSNRKYISGGTDLVLVKHYAKIDIDCIIDISDVKELKIVKEDKKNIFIGSAVKISELENRVIEKYVPALYKSIKYFASPTLRNLATLGGNIANASPSADGVCALVASKAKAVLNLKGRKRILDVKDIAVGPKKTILKKDEIIEGIIIPKWQHKAVFFKMMPRKLFGIAKAGLCLCADIKSDVIKDIKIALSSVAPKVIEAEKTQNFLKGKKIDSALIDKASEIIKTEISPIDDHRSTGEYRKKIISVYLRRAFKELC